MPTSITGDSSVPVEKVAHSTPRWCLLTPYNDLSSNDTDDRDASHRYHPHRPHLLEG